MCTYKYRKDDGACAEGEGTEWGWNRAQQERELGLEINRAHTERSEGAINRKP